MSVDDEPPIEASARRRVWGVAALKLIAGLALFVCVVLWLAPSGAELRARVELDARFLLLGFVCTTLANLVASARWKLMVEAMGGTRLRYAVYFHGMALTRVLGQLSSSLVMDLVGRGVVLRTAGSRRGLGHAMTQVVLERVYDILLPAVMLVWAVLVRRALGGDPQLAALVFTGVCLVFAVVAAAALWPLSRVALALYGRVRRWRGGANDDAPEGDASPIGRRDAALVGLYSLARYLCVVAQFWMVALAVGVNLDFIAIATATPVGQLAAIIGVTPGALGIQEVGWAGGLGWVGVEPVAIGLFVISVRVLVTSFFCVLTALSYPLARRASPRARR
ncbi:MAG: flippase-like domain-containing protein [Myxococcales bacterium]|nr:flippase-like domain-containing protein [Myxococcales bacterium]